MNLRLDGASLQNRQQLHQEIAKQLCFPRYYGENLDALWDMLSSWNTPLTITVVNTQRLLQQMGDYGEALLQVLQEAAEENPIIQMTIDL